MKQILEGGLDTQKMAIIQKYDTHTEMMASETGRRAKSEFTHTHTHAHHNLLEALRTSVKLSSV